MPQPVKANNSPSQTLDNPSWLALLARTTLGPNFAFVHVKVQSNSLPVLASAQGAHRLIVQVYPRTALRDGHLLASARPLASAQRAVHAESLRTGVSVLLTGFERTNRHARDRLVVVAWVEAGSPNLELDGADTRPSWNSCARFSLVSKGQSEVTLKLRPSLVASLSPSLSSSQSTPQSTPQSTSPSAIAPRPSCFPHQLVCEPCG